MALQVSDYSRGYCYRYEYERFVEVGDSSHPPMENWHLDTLVRAVGLDLSQQFRWMAETDTIQTYEHCVTSRYIHIDSETGQFCDQNRNLTSAEAALAHAMEPSPFGSQPPAESNLELEIGLFVRHRSWNAAQIGQYTISWMANCVLLANRWKIVLAGTLHRLAAEMRSSGIPEERTSAPVDRSVGLAEYKPGDFQLQRFSRKAA